MISRRELITAMVTAPALMGVASVRGAGLSSIALGQMQGTSAHGSWMNPLPLQDAIKRFLGYRYGAFIHWGPSSQTGKEISFARHASMPADEYDNLYKKFNPIEFDAKAWVKALKAGGFRYLVWVPKHHDGFAMWDTKTIDYNIMNSPFKRDVTKEIAEACKELDLPLFLYYSISDFYHPDCVGATNIYGSLFGPQGVSLPEGQSPDFGRYVQYMKDQLKELTENYGPVAGWWFDGGWQKEWTYERGLDLYNYMHKLQPGVLMNNRVGAAYNGDIYMPTWFPVEKNKVGDYAVLEVDLPRFNRELPWEYTKPGNDRSYSWSPGPWPDSSKWMDYLVKSACGDGNFILGISATPLGRLEPALIDRMRQANDWLEQYGVSLFNTRGGPYKRTAAYGCTCRGNVMYLHVFDTKATKLVLPALPKKINKFSMLNGGDVKVTQTKQTVTVEISQYDFQSPTTIVALELDGSAEDIAPFGEVPLNRNVAVRSSNTSASSDKLASDGNMATYWKSDGKTEQPWLEYDLGSEKSISRAVLFEGSWEGEYANIQELVLEAKVDNEWKVLKEANGSLGGAFVPNSHFENWPISILHPEIRFTAVTARHVRLKLVKAKRQPIINEFEIYSV